MFYHSAIQLAPLESQLSIFLSLQLNKPDEVDTNDDPADKTDRYTLAASIGTIVGSSVAIIAAIFFFGLLIYVFVYKRRKEKANEGNRFSGYDTYIVTILT